MGLRVSTHSETHGKGVEFKKISEWALNGRPVSACAQ